MVDAIPVILFVFGWVALGKPEWVAAIDRRQKALGTTCHSRDIEMSETYYAIVRIGGIVLVLFGLFFIIQSW